MAPDDRKSVCFAAPGGRGRGSSRGDPVPRLEVAVPSLSSEAVETAPDVRVVVIVYNDAERLPVAVRSVLDQSLRTVEVIIADDCSTDGSFEVARSLEAAH